MLIVSLYFKGEELARQVTPIECKSADGSKFDLQAIYPFAKTSFIKVVWSELPLHITKFNSIHFKIYIYEWSVRIIYTV